MAAVRPASLTLVSPYSVVTLADAMRSMDVLALYFLVSRDLGRFRVTCHRLAYSYVSVSVSRATSSLTCTFPFPSHVTFTVLV